MSIDLNTIISLILTVIVSYIGYTFKDRDSKKDERIKCVESEVKCVKETVSKNDTKYYRDFITKEQHDMDINSVLKKLDEINSGITLLNRDVGTLIGKIERD